jgi:hypothetical protein
MDPDQREPIHRTAKVMPPQLAIHVVTVSTGPRTNTAGTRVPAAGANTVAALADALRDIPASPEAWWSPHTWDGDRRSGRRWVAACAVALDLDFHDVQGRHAEPTPDARRALRVAIDGGTGNLFHDTPRGARIVFVLDAPTMDREAYTQAANGAASLMTRVLEAHDLGSSMGQSGYAVDHSAKDFARFLYAPRSIVHGRARSAELLVLCDHPFLLADLAALTPPAVKRLEKIRANAGQASLKLNDAVRHWNEDHAQDWGPPGQGECPACRHHGCFGRLPELPEKWNCFSGGPDGHEARTQGRCGRLGNAGHWFGDALDMEAYGRGETRLQVLRRDGYLAAMSHEAPDAP